MNILATMLSLFTGTKSAEEVKVFDYEAPDGKLYSGVQTNEAATKYFISQLADQEELFGRYLVFATKECIETPVPGLGGCTTYEYFESVINAEIENWSKNNTAISSIIEQDYSGSTEEYIKDTVRVIPVESIPTVSSLGSYFARELNDIIEANDALMNSVYMDFSGGSRASGMLLIMLLRIFEQINTKVCGIIYSNISQGHPKLEEITEFYNLLASIEEIAKQESLIDFSKKLKELGIVPEDSDISSGLDVIERKQREQENEYLPSDEKTVFQSIQNTKAKSGIAKALEKQAADKLKKAFETSIFDKLKAKNDLKLIEDFHSCILDYFVNSKTIQIDGCKDSKYAARELLANESYYNGEISQYSRTITTHGVLPTVKKWLVLLKTNRSINPATHWNKQSKITSFIDDEWKLPWNPKAVNEKMTKDFLNYYLDLDPFEGQYYSDYGIICDFSKYQTLYYNYGFPFACTGGKTDCWSYLYISNHYRICVANLMSDLSELKKTDINDYSLELDKLIDGKGELEKRIPYYTKNWKVDERFFPGQAEKESFIRDLCSKLEKVRPFRNAIAHHLNNDYSNPDQQKEIATSIRTWLDEYKKRFYSKGSEING